MRTDQNENAETQRKLDNASYTLDRIESSLPGLIDLAKAGKIASVERMLGNLQHNVRQLRETYGV